MDARLIKLLQAARSPKGRNVLVFLAFLVIAAVLWVVQSLNEEVQSDLRCHVRITNVPDSMVRVSPLPEAINVSVLAKGTELIKFWGEQPDIVIDYRRYKHGNRILMGESSIKSFVRNMVGATCQVQSVSPDSLSIAYTSLPGVRLPVKLDAHVIPAHQYVLREKVRLLQDSVTLYSLDGARRVTMLSTVPINLVDVTKDQLIRVPVIVPSNCRAIPDSVDVSVRVEPLVSKTRRVNVTAINTPEGEKLILVPPRVEVHYMLPMSIYKENNKEPNFKVVADYNATRNAGDKKIPITLESHNKDYINVFLTEDSIDYIIERR